MNNTQLFCVLLSVCSVFPLDTGPVQLAVVFILENVKMGQD